MALPDGLSAREGQGRRVLLDLTPSSVAGQRTRAQAFLRRFRNFDKHSKLVVVQARATVADLEGDDRTVLIDAGIADGRLRALRRLIWQNAKLPGLVRQYGIDTYLSFSNYLPRTLPSSVASIVGVMNLAPFSQAAVAAERSSLGRLRLRILRRTTLSSSRRAGRVIALSQACRHELERNGIDASKIRVIPNGVEAMESPGHDQAATLVRQGITRGYLLYVSHFYAYKNFERLIRAYRALPEPLQEKYQLVLVGAPHDARYFAEIMDLIGSTRAGRIIVIPGASKDMLQDLYAGTSLFVFPSLVEACPNILLEAMAHGAPVLASNIPPMPEFGGAAARYFDPFSQEEMTRAMLVLLDDKTARDRMRSESVVQADRYTWDEFTQRVVEAYSSAQ
jgi:glycosyltransferase involved in cell wall biosynthesis